MLSECLKASIFEYHFNFLILYVTNIPLHLLKEPILFYNASKFRVDLPLSLLLIRLSSES